VREETRKLICIICNRPIESWQRPSVLLEDGSEVHMECYKPEIKIDPGKPPN